MLRVGFDRLSAGPFIINSLLLLFKKKHLGVEIRILRPPSITIDLSSSSTFFFPPPLFFLSVSFSFIVFVSLLYSSTSKYKFYYYTAARGSGSISETYVGKHHDVISRDTYHTTRVIWRSTQYFFFFLNTIFFLPYFLRNFFSRVSTMNSKVLSKKKNLLFENERFNIIPCEDRF